MRITKDQLKAALDIIGLDFTEEQRDMMLPDVNRALTVTKGCARSTFRSIPSPRFISARRCREKSRNRARCKIHADARCQARDVQEIRKTSRFSPSPSSPR